MPRSRRVRAFGHAVRLGLFLLVTWLTGQFLVDTISMRGWGPGALFGLLLFAGAISLVWRASIDFRKSVRRLRT